MFAAENTRLAGAAEPRAVGRRNEPIVIRIKQVGTDAPEFMAQTEAVLSGHEAWYVEMQDNRGWRAIHVIGVTPAER